MRRSAWIYLASIFLPSLGLAWLAARSMQDQEVVLEHQQVIISQNITDALAQNIQSQMDQMRADFVSTTQQMLAASAAPQGVAEDFNSRLRDAWPMAEIGFAVNLDGEIYSPKPFDGPNARAFRSENDRFLSNRENAEVYSSSGTTVTQNAKLTQNLARDAQLKFANNNPDMPATQQEQAEQAATLEKITEAAHALKQAAALRQTQQMRAPVATPQAQDASLANAARQTDLGMTQSVLQSAPLTGAAPTAPAPAQDLDQKDEEARVARQIPPAAPTPAASSGSATEEFQSKNKKIIDELHASKKASISNTDSDSSTADKSAARPPAAVSGGSTNAAFREQIGGLQGEMDDLASDAAKTSLPSGGSSNAAATSPVVESVPTGTTASPAPRPIAPSAAPASTTAPEVSANVNASVAQADMAAASDTVQQVTPQSLKSQFNSKIPRQVIPLKMLNNDTEALSNTVPEESDFRRVVGAEASGALARFLENKLRLMVWSHPADTPIIFGAQLDTARLAGALKSAFDIPELKSDSFAHAGRSEYCVAILDDTGQPVALSQPGFPGDWKHPFVATEIGEALPHWEAALYLTDPLQISRAARTLQLTLGLVVLVLVVAIFAGGSLITADVRRQMRLAQQKTDFVSNVSHELKTPLTSIRMFADLLAEKRVPDEQRQSTYLRIISAEAARLTRLINNVLDFARIERGAPKGEHHDCDLVDAVRDVVETCGPHLEAAGLAFQCEIEADRLPIHGDRDALAQIILNLVSNAEKYGGSDILVRVRRQETPASVLGCVDVLDRGPGIPAEKVKTVFEPFHRLDDSLSSGIPGSGLGLTLARRMARSHGGDVTYSPRAGGGSCFTLTVPLLHHIPSP